MPTIDRRTLIAGAGAGLAGGGALAQALVDLGLPGGPSQRATRPSFPQKGTMIVQRTRPPLLETPFDVFADGGFTPNDRFFVRWAGGVMPTAIEPRGHRLVVHGAVRRPLWLALDEVLRSGEHVEVAAVCQCAGNSRGYQEPRVTGAQWGHGAMGNALWRGVWLRDVLDRAGISANARNVRFAGLDVPMIEGQPQYKKSLPVDIARRDDVIVAFAMNGTALPLLNGFPLRLVVPGWYATHWVKMLSDIEVLTGEDDSYYMAKSYRMPAVAVAPGDKDFATKPVTTMGPRSFITSHRDGAVVRRGARIALSGFAFGGDSALARVAIEIGGRRVEARLDREQGALGFRRWTAVLPGFDHDVSIAVRATNAAGASQPDAHAWNPSGYARTSVERITLRAA